MNTAGPMRAPSLIVSGWDAVRPYALHASVFVTTSILFWKWMTLNVGLLIAMRYLCSARPRPGHWCAMAGLPLLALPAQ